MRDMTCEAPICVVVFNNDTDLCTFKELRELLAPKRLDASDDSMVNLNPLLLEGINGSRSTTMGISEAEDFHRGRSGRTTNNIWNGARCSSSNQANVNWSSNLIDGPEVFCDLSR